MLPAVQCRLCASNHTAHALLPVELGEIRQYLGRRLGAVDLGAARGGSACTEGTGAPCNVMPTNCYIYHAF